MKTKQLILTTIFLFIGFVGHAQTITTGSVTGSKCAGTSFSLSYTKTGIFGPANVFTAQLSNASGSFSSPVVIGSVNASGNGTILVTIPTNTAFGTGYRIRIVSSHPSITGSLNSNGNITINAKPTIGAIASPSANVCLGNSVTLSGTGATSYSWNNSVINGVAFVANTLGNTTYTVTGTTANGCTSTTTSVITVNALPTIGSTVSPSISVCQGNNVTLTGTGASTYSWNNGVTNGVAFVANTPGNTIYTVTGTDANGCTNTATRTILVAAATTTPTITAASATTFCSGGSVILNTSSTASTAYNGCVFRWYRNGTLVSTSSYLNKDNQGNVTNSFTATIAGNYTVTATQWYFAFSGINEYCTSQLSTPTVVTVNPLPTVTANASATTLCEGSQLTLTGGGANTYTWNNGVTNGVAFVANTLGSTTYTVTGTNANGCTNTATRLISVKPVPATPTITAASATTFCSGGSVILNTSSTASNAYNGCVFRWYRNGTLVATSNYLNKNNQGIVTNSYTATIAGSYTVTATNWYYFVFSGYSEDCTSQLSAPTVVTVNPLPTVTANASAINLCEGSQLTLTGGGANTYTWNNGVTNGVAFTASTPGSTTYTVIGTDANGCSNSANRSVYVNPRPTTPNITAASATTFCSGGSVILNTSSIASSGFSGCVFRWYRNGTLVSTSNYLTKNNQGLVTNSFTATIAGNYTVTATHWIYIFGYQEFCTSQLSASTVVTINTLPTAAISTSNANLSCTTPSVILTATGGTSYQWNATGNNETTAGITATTAGTYTVIVANTAGCTATASATISSNQTPPNASITAPTTACVNNSIILSVADAGVGSTYGWTGNGINATNSHTTTATPTNFGNQTYTVLVTGPNGCTASSSTQVNVSNSANWYQDFDGDGFGNPAITQNVCSQPIGYVANNTDCNDNDNTANILAIPSVITALSTTTFCASDSVILTGNTGGVWSNGSTTSSITVHTDGDYFVTNTTSCNSVTSNHINVTTIPITSWWQDADGDGDGNPFVVTFACTQPTGYVANADDCNDANSSYNSSLVWYLDFDGDGFGGSAQSYAGCDPGSTMFVLNSLDCDDSNNLIHNSFNFYADADGDGMGAGSLVSVCAIDEFTPPTGYSLVNTDCNDTNNAVQSAPIASVISASGSTNICSGSSVALVGNTGGIWNTGASTSSITVNSAGSYSVTTSNACGSVTSNTINITIAPLPIASTITAGSATSFCAGGSVTLSGNVGGIWSTGETTASINVNTAASYSVTTSNSCGSVTSNAISVSVNANPTPTIVGDANFCPNSNTTLATTQNYNVYLWSNGSSAASINVNVANTYSVNVTDANGCTGSASVTINACAGVGPQGSFPANQCGYITNIQSGSMLCNTTIGANGYLVKFYTINSNTVYAQKTISTNSVTFTNLIPALQDGSQYDVTVTPIMLSGASGVESEKCRMGIIAAQTPNSVAACSLSTPACVANASSAPVLSNTSSIRCSAVIQASTYQFRFENIANPSEVVLAYQSAPRVRTLAPLNLTAGATYAVSVRATVAGVQASSFGSICYIKMAAPATRESSQEFKIEDLKFNISVSPNPINGYSTIFISSNEDEEANVVLTDITGKVVFTVNIATNTNSEFRIQNSELQSGIYFVTATLSNGERKTIKVVKN